MAEFLPFDRLNFICRGGKRRRLETVASMRLAAAAARDFPEA